MNERYLAIGETIRAIEALDASLELEQRLEAIRPLLQELASRTDLFSPEAFAIRPHTLGGLYELFMAPDRSLSLYAAAGAKGKYQPPHNHTTWAVIAGVRGEEINNFYARTDDGAITGEGALEYLHTLTVGPRGSVSIGADSFHTIRVDAGDQALHLHLYGNALDTLKERIGFESEAGGAYKRFMATPATCAPWVSCSDLHTMLNDGQELAIIDVRPGRHYAKGHLFYAASVPLVRLDADIEILVPQKDARIVLIDDDGRPGGAAESAVRTLHRLGFHNIGVLLNGLAAWDGPLYGGMFTPSKAFGEVAEHHFGIESVKAHELATMNPRPLILDCRTPEEFKWMSIPGAISCPGGELVKCALNHEGPIVLNCAGRTRSIMGALSLKIAGHNNVFPVENGTMGQALAGMPLVHGHTERLAEAEDVTLAILRTQALRKEYGLRVITLEQAREINNTRYLLDVRDPSHYHEGHLAGSVSAPGGQLVQQTDMWCPVLGATLVLIDTDGLISTTTGIWLQLMGWNVAILMAKPGQLIHTQIDGSASFELADDTMMLVDIGDSREYRRGHVPSSAWIARADLLSVIKDKQHQKIGVTARNTRLTTIVVNELLAQGYDARAIVRNPLVTENPQYLSEPHDVWYPPYELDQGVEEAMREYLSWETGLLEQIRTDPHVRFRI